MKNLSLLLQISLQKDLVGLFFGLAEDDGPSMPSSIKIDDISNH